MKKLLSVIIALTMVAFSLSALTGCETGPREEEKKLSLDQATIEIEQYEEATLTASKDGVEWASSDPRTVSVDDKGNITSLKLGSATVTATLGEETASCEVTVIPATKGRALSVSADSVKLKLDEQATVTAALKEDGSVLDVDLAWSVDHADVATVENGVITAVGKGQTKVTVSVTYKGQLFTKEISVVVASHAEAAWIMGDAATALPAYDGDVKALGFKEGTTVYKWTTTADGWASRISDASVTAVDSEYEVLVTNIMFTSAKIGDFMFWYGDTTIKMGHDFVGDQLTHAGSTNGDIVRLYNADGSPVSDYYIEANKIYTLVVDVKGLGGKLFGIGAFGGVTDIYLANGVICSRSYAREAFPGLQIAIYDNLYVGQGDNLSMVAPLEDGDYAGWCKIDYAADYWGTRVLVGREDINTPFVVNSKYSEYDYYGFEVVFTDASLVNLIAWNGSLNAIFAYADGTLAAQNGVEVKADDFVITKAGVNVTGQALEANVVYNIRIKIQKAADPYGLGINAGTVAGSMYVRNAYFI